VILINKTWSKGANSVSWCYFAKGDNCCCFSKSFRWYL